MLVSLTVVAELWDSSRCQHRHQHYQHSCSFCLNISRKLFSRNYTTKFRTTSHQLKAIKFRRFLSIFTFILQLGPQPLAFLFHQPHNFSPFPFVPLANRTLYFTIQITLKRRDFRRIKNPVKLKRNVIHVNWQTQQ
jgi:hypothetical protein